MILLPDSESRMIVASLVSTEHRNVTEDRQTDTPFAITAVALQAVLHCKQCGPAVKTVHKEECYNSLSGENSSDSDIFSQELSCC